MSRRLTLAAVLVVGLVVVIGWQVVEHRSLQRSDAAMWERMKGDPALNAIPAGAQVT